MKSQLKTIALSGTLPFGAIERVSRLLSTDLERAERVQRLLALAGGGRRSGSLPATPALQRLS